MIYEVSGDILLSKAQAIAHGVAPNDHFTNGLALSLRERYPALRIFLSTTTLTGQQIARTRIQDVDAVFFFPFDLPFIVNRTLGLVKPRLFVMMETEIWPNLLRACRQRGIKTMLVNGRISSRSYPRYKLVRPFFRTVLQDVDRFCMQSDESARRIIDIGADAADREQRPGLVPPEELDGLVERIHAASRGESRLATGAAASNLDLYQVNCTFHAALGGDDLTYLLARAVQFFLPGIPQVYYVGLLAGGNDMALLRETGIGRDINRRRFAPGEAEAALARPVVRELLRLIRLRNESPAFDGCFRSRTVAEHGLAREWTNGPHAARLSVDLRSRAYAIDLVDDGAASSFRFDLDASGSAPPAAPF